jgi:hypothetical protein
MPDPDVLAGPVEKYVDELFRGWQIYPCAVTARQLMETDMSNWDNVRRATKELLDIEARVPNGGDWDFPCVVMKLAERWGVLPDDIEAEYDVICDIAFGLKGN